MACSPYPILRTGAKGNGSVARTLELTGTLADINNALANGLQYDSAGFLGTTTLTILSNDHGSTGPGAH